MIPTLTRYFHPLVARWFLERIGTPTDLQEQAWPLIAGGEHLLITGPTGSGKTLAAFLWAIDRLITGKWEPGRPRVLYVSPLKALNNDIQRNLIGPLNELRQVFAEAGEPFPPIRVLTRSGDTPPSDRRRMLRHPPEVLITTPESLNLLLSSAASRMILSGVLTVILDEIHAVVGSKRGTHLITAVDRMVPLCGEFQRIALSATVEPPEVVARFVGGFRPGGHGFFAPRPVRVLVNPTQKRYEIRVRFPDALPEGPDSFWLPFVDEVKAAIAGNRSTLVFANSRRLAEKITYLVNLGEEKPIAYAHHGSLSREIRVEVEQKLKAGELKAIVATSSLELGIDIGTLDEVILLQAPSSFSSAIQRIGRAGHRVGDVSRARLLPTHPMDMVESAVLACAVPSHDLERVQPVEAPLDVLAQILISMAGTEPWGMDRLFDQVRTSYPFRNLSREQFDMVLDMLAGRFAATRLRELEPRLSIDRLDHTVSARKGALQALYASGGTIPDRGAFHLRHSETQARIGELDEEFVWEARVGQVFTLGTQNWRIEGITHNEVFVLPADPRSSAPPFWKAEESLRDFHFSERIGEFLERVDEHLLDSDFQDVLSRSHFMDRHASEELIRFLRRQKEVTGSPLPHRRHLLVEFVGTGPGGYPGTQVVLHTLWGGRVNKPYALALEAAWESRFGHQLPIYASDDCVLLQLPHDVRSEEILSLVTCAEVDNLLRKRLESTGFFGARFRECAGRALLLARWKAHERMPLWLSRLRSQKLLDAVLPYPDFPILLEAWRTCLQDEFDLEALHRVLSELESGAIRWTEARTTHPSPMAQAAAWPQINEYMYMDDRMRSGKTSRMRQDLIREVIRSPEMRPAVSEELIGAFEQKRMRLAEGYSPDSSRDLLDWVKERVLIPLSEWEKMLSAILRDHEMDREMILSPIAHKLARIRPGASVEPLVVALERAPEVLAAFYSGARVPVESVEGRAHPSPPSFAGEPPEEAVSSLLAEWLAFYGPTARPWIRTTLGLDPLLLERALVDLADAERILTGDLVRETEEERLCDTENFEILLRLARAAARPALEPLDIRLLQPFLARHQGLARSAGSMDLLFRTMEQLVCFDAPANAWETVIFPARLKPYDPAWLDMAMQTGSVVWQGRKNRRVHFCFKSDMDLMKVPGEKREGTDLEGLFPDPRAKYDFSALLQMGPSRPSELTEALWRGVWEGRVSNDTFLALRKGMETGFKLPSAALDRARARKGTSRSAFSRWKATVPLAGNWFRITAPEGDDDLIEREERNKDRARLLLDRYGVLFREILQNEAPSFRWSAIFRSLRLMELSGEVLTGYFFRGVPGPQFISHEAFRALQRHFDGLFWLCATDPASLCGIPLEALKGRLPRRVAGTHLIYRGSSLVLVSRQNGRELTFHIPPDDPDLQNTLLFMQTAMTRSFQPHRRIVIETINGEPAGRSPYLAAFRAAFDVTAGYRKVTLYPSAARNHHPL
jgi:ATP-dependent helicase Lhr and Lhr-like helicase